MKVKTGYFTSFDGLELFFRGWLKPESPTALILVHGFGEHSGRYEEFAESLHDLPCSILIHDLRGHGKSGGERVFVNDFDDFVLDLYEFRSFVLKNLTPQAPRFILFGHSLGGLIAVRSILKSQNEWQNLILSSPFFGLFGSNGIALFLLRLFNCVAPHLVVHNPVNPVFLTHDSDRVKEYTTDSMIQRKTTIRLSKEMLEAGEQTMGEAAKITIPLFVLTGSKERIVSPERIRQFYHSTKFSQRELQVFDGFYHELFQETGREQFFTAIKGYLKLFL